MCGNPDWFRGSLCAGVPRLVDAPNSDPDWKRDCGMAAHTSLAQLAPSGRFRAIVAVLRVFAAFAIVTGLLDGPAGFHQRSRTSRSPR